MNNYVKIDDVMCAVKMRQSATTINCKAHLFNILYCIVLYCNLLYCIMRLYTEGRVDRYRMGIPGELPEISTQPFY